MKSDNKKFALFLPMLLPEYIAPFCSFLGLKKCGKINKSFFNFKNDLILSAISAFIIWMIIRIPGTKHYLDSITSVAIWLLGLISYIFAANLIKSEEDIYKVFKSFSFAGGASGFIGTVQMVLFHLKVPFGKYINPFWHFLDLSVEKIVVLLPAKITENFQKTEFLTFPTRASGTCSNPLFFAAISLMLMPFCIFFFLCGKTKKERLVGLITFLLTASGIGFSYSRGPYIYACLVALVLLLYGGKRIIKLLAVGAGGFAFILVFARGMLKRIFTLGDDTEISVNTRKLIWDAIFDMIKERPLIGYGTGFRNIGEILEKTYHIKQPHAHNIFLEYFAEGGILSPILLLLIFIAFFAVIVKLYLSKGEARIFAITLFAAVLGFALCGLTDCPFYGIKPIQFFMILMGITTAAFNVYKTRKTAESCETIDFSTK